MSKPELSRSIVENTVKRWAKFCEKSDDFCWTKSDSTAYLLIHNYVVDCKHEEYLKNKKKKDGLVNNDKKSK